MATIDRIDNCKGYSPDNCRWATVHTQCANRRDNNKTVGVSFHKSTGKWFAKINLKGRQVYLGVYEKYADAVTARRTAEINNNVYALK